MPTLGIDIGGSSVKAALWDGAGFLWTRTSGQFSRPDRARLIAAILEATGDGLPPLDAIGLCVPGLLDRPRQLITLSVNVPGLVGTPLPELLAAAIGRRIPRSLTITTDAHAAGFDIYSQRQIQGRLLVISLGTGVGAAVLDDGVALQVDGESPGHLGQVDVSVPGHPAVGPDGGSGSLEGYLGAPAITSSYNMDPRMAVARWTGSEPQIEAMVRIIRICHGIYRPVHICLTGGIGICMDHLLTVIRAKVQHGLTKIARDGWTLTCGDDGFHAARGTCRLAMCPSPRP